MFLTQGYGLHGTAVRDRNQSEIPNLRCSREMSILAYRSRERSSNSKVTSVLHAGFISMAPLGSNCTTDVGSILKPKYQTYPWPRMVAIAILGADVTRREEYQWMDCIILGKLG